MVEYGLEEARQLLQIHLDNVEKRQAFLVLRPPHSYEEGGGA